MSPRSTPTPTPGRYRYGLVLLLTIAAVIDVIVAPETAASRAVTLSIQGGTLLAVIATSREARAVRRIAAISAAGVILALALAVGFSLVPRWVASATAAIAMIAVLVVLVRGVTRLIRDRGVTPQAVAGALTIYLLVGLTFALAISLLARVGPTYFTQGRDGSLSEQTYFSFTTMTTTGYGDLTPATRTGHALAVLEMLIGQIYLVTVIGLLVGNLNSRRRGEDQPTTTAV